MTILEHELLLSEQLRRVPLAELQARISKFRAVMDRDFPGWEIAIVNNKVNMYYFAGTMQDGVLVIRPRTRCCGCAAVMNVPATSRCWKIFGRCKAFALWQSSISRCRRRFIWKKKQRPWNGCGCYKNIYPLAQARVLTASLTSCGWSKALTS